ncbi:chloramphenicol acetyltransferase [Flaviaesturariibacter amylovorans]|uniref:Chloramphenicol acetyltransferase n=1 Tax=Flaviaesturariibacter amylovorans TaxID=1084520 RepID=A0ABP8H9U5_9BACT
MKRSLDLSTWPRRDHFNFFRKFEEPFFGVTVDVDCTKAYARAKEGGYSFFLYYLWCSLKAANATEPFRYRISGDEVLCYDEIHASPTINRPDGTFGFSYMNWHPEFPVFLRSASAETERVRQSSGLVPAMSGENVIHYSSIPWIRFTSIAHARSFSYPDSCPKMAFGKMEERDGRRTMPHAVHAHHALMDGYHAAQYLERFQEALDAQ